MSQTAVQVRVLPELAILFQDALRLLRERGWQGWGYEDQGVLSIDGALVVAAGGTASGQHAELSGRPLALAKAASMFVVACSRLPVEQDCLWEWEYDGAATQDEAIRVVEVAYAVYIAATRQPVRLNNPLGDHEAPVLYGTARGYRDGDHRIEVDCGRYGTVFVAPHRLQLDVGERAR